jgi:hypothetical protein
MREQLERRSQEAEILSQQLKCQAHELQDLRALVQHHSQQAVTLSDRLHSQTRELNDLNARLQGNNVEAELSHLSASPAGSPLNLLPLDRSHQQECQCNDLCDPGTQLVWANGRMFAGQSVHIERQDREAQRNQRRNCPHASEGRPKDGEGAAQSRSRELSLRSTGRALLRDAIEALQVRRHHAFILVCLSSST